MAVYADDLPQSYALPGYETLMQSWCVRETSHWTRQSLDYGSVLKKIDRLHQTIKGFSYFEIRGGAVSTREPPERLSGGGADRQSMYLAFLRETVRLFCPDISVDLVIFWQDGGFDSDVPVFSFQKKTNQTCVLLPDVDFLRDRFFYPLDFCKDGLKFHEKKPSAIFVGSTSGYAVTKETINTLAHPRVRAAMFFRDSELVNFHLPVIVQHDSDHTKELLVSMGFGNTPPIPWEKQFEHKFIISMDGNGATCSRLPITFHSNSVLLKYDSESVLYYSSGLAPWVHYIPISAEEQINHVVQAERAQPGRFAYITEEAQRFAKTYLTRYRAMQYTSRVLRSYASTVNPELNPSSSMTNSDSPLSVEAQFGAVLAHIDGRGDVWAAAGQWVGDAGSGRAIQGLAIEPGVALSLDEIWYQVVFQDGSLSEWRDGGAFCGTRGRSQPIFGLRIRLRGPAAEKYAIFYSCRFVGGISVGPMPNDSLCKSSAGAPLEGIMIEFEGRHATRDQEPRSVQTEPRNVHQNAVRAKASVITPHRPLPPYQILGDVGRFYERDGQKLLELPVDSLRMFIRCILRCLPFDTSLYLQHYPEFKSLSDLHHHWLEHGYFEGRLVYGWERLPFDFRELLNAPESYFMLVQKAAGAAEGRCYRKAEEAYKEAIDAFPVGIAARVGLADLLFKLRRTLDSEAVLRGALERAPGSGRANWLLVEVLTDLGLHDLACSVSLSSGQHANTARQVLRLLSRGNLALSRHQACVASDDWPTLQNLRQRIKAEWRDARVRLARLHVLAREAGSASVDTRVALALCLARLGLANRSREFIATLLAAEADVQVLWSSTATFLSLVEAVRVNDGAKAACDIMKSAPAAVLAVPDVLVVRFDLAYQSGDRHAIEALAVIFSNVAIAPVLLETWCRSLVYRRNFDEAIRVCAQHWPSIAHHRWLPSIVLQIGRLRGWYSGVSLDEEAGDVNLSGRIPRRIMQFWDCETPPDDVRTLISSWPERNPGYEHVLFSNETAILFLRERYGNEYVDIFEYCHHPVMKADFFRLAYIVAMGGIYVDADEYCETGLNSLISAYPARDLFLSLSESDFFVNNRFLGSAPEHPFLIAVLSSVVADMQRAMQTGEKPDIWHTTGPSQYSKVFAELLMAGGEASRAVIARIGLVYAHELGRYLASRPLQYKATQEGNWRAR